MGELKSAATFRSDGEVCLEVESKSCASEKIGPFLPGTLSGHVSSLDSRLQNTRTDIGAAGAPSERFLFSNNWRGRVPGLALPDLRRQISDADKLIESGFWQGWTRRQVREYYAAKFHSPWKLAAHCLCRKCGSPLRPFNATGLGPCGLTAEEMELLRPYWNPSRLAGKRCSHAK